MRIAMKNRRLEMGCSQDDIAKLMGVTCSFYAKIERGEKKPSADKLLLLETILGLPAAKIMEKNMPATAETQINSTTGT